ncbi:MAG: hypothetical protein KDB92_03575 [Chitinophagaceae bacterium]|nr:hypothetical protein [Chitinophagaceae bacterium]
MKKYILKNEGIFILIVSILIFSFTGCKKTESSQQKDFFIASETKSVIELDNATQLENLVTQLAGEKQEIKYIIQPVVTELNDKNGIFKAIKAKYRIGDNVTNIVIPLIKENKPSFASQAENGSRFSNYYSNTCEMKCTSAWGCQECTQTIIEQCKSQKYSCTSGGGGCSSKITFP